MYLTTECEYSTHTTHVQKRYDLCPKVPLSGKNAGKNWAILYLKQTIMSCMPAPDLNGVDLMHRLGSDLSLATSLDAGVACVATTLERTFAPRDCQVTLLIAGKPRVAHARRCSDAGR